MKFQDIQKLAKNMGINAFRMKKIDLIRSIQREENNIECYGTPRVDHCGEMSCLWRSDCIGCYEIIVSARHSHRSTK
jgi:hypothetical protein